MTTQPTPLHDVDAIVTTLLDIQQQQAYLAERERHLKTQLADRVGVGNSQRVGQVTVSVRGPSRRFNLARATTMLTDEQRAVCQSLDAAKVRKQLPEVLLEQCYDEGTGAPIVSVK